jgi:hypothetical protein
MWMTKTRANSTWLISGTFFALYHPARKTGGNRLTRANRARIPVVAVLTAFLGNRFGLANFLAVLALFPLSPAVAVPVFLQVDQPIHDGTVTVGIERGGITKSSTANITAGESIADKTRGIAGALTANGFTAKVALPNKVRIGGLLAGITVTATDNGTGEDNMIGSPAASAGALGFGGLFGLRSRLFGGFSTGLGLAEIGMEFREDVPGFIEGDPFLAYCNSDGVCFSLQLQSLALASLAGSDITHAYFDLFTTDPNVTNALGLVDVKIDSLQDGEIVAGFSRGTGFDAVSFGSNSQTGSVSGAVTITTVPEPPTVALLVAGLGLFFLLFHRTAAVQIKCQRSAPGRQ